MYMPIEFCWSNNVYRTWGCAVVSYCKKARPPLSGFLTLWKTNNFWTVVLHAEWILGQMSRWFKFGERKFNLKEASYARDWSVWQESRCVCMCIGELCEQPTAIVCLHSPLSLPSLYSVPKSLLLSADLTIYGSPALCMSGCLQDHFLSLSRLADGNVCCLEDSGTWVLKM